MNNWRKKKEIRCRLFSCPFPGANLVCRVGILLEFIELLPWSDLASRNLSWDASRCSSNPAISAFQYFIKSHTGGDAVPNSFQVYYLPNGKQHLMPGPFGDLPDLAPDILAVLYFSVFQVGRNGTKVVGCRNLIYIFRSKQMNTSHYIVITVVCSFM